MSGYNALSYINASFRLLALYIKSTGLTTITSPMLTTWLHLIPRYVDKVMYENRWIADVLVVGLRLEELADVATEP